jgi:hypothetical protein
MAGAQNAERSIAEIFGNYDSGAGRNRGDNREVAVIPKWLKLRLFRPTLRQTLRKTIETSDKLTADLVKLAHCDCVATIKGVMGRARRIGDKKANGNVK